MKQANQRRVQAVLALKLLEVIRDRDLPGELLEDEDPTVTIPRRFGLSDVVERQIRTFREEARRGGKLSDREIGDLFRLVIRRPDAEMVFHEAGLLLAEDDAAGRWPRALPTKTRFSVARSRVGKRLRKLFGRPVGDFETGAFVLEAREHFLIDTDPGGDACHLVSGLCQQVLAHTIGGAPVVKHTDCRSTGSETCRWEGVLEAPPATLDLAEAEDEAEALDAEQMVEDAGQPEAADAERLDSAAVHAEARDAYPTPANDEPAPTDAEPAPTDADPADTAPTPAEPTDTVLADIAPADDASTDTALADAHPAPTDAEPADLAPTHAVPVDAEASPTAEAPIEPGSPQPAEAAEAEWAHEEPAVWPESPAPHDAPEPGVVPPEPTEERNVQTAFSLEAEEQLDVLAPLETEDRQSAPKEVPSEREHEERASADEETAMGLDGAAVGMRDTTDDADTGASEEVPKIP